MQLENRFTVAAPIDEAWAVLLDIDRVAHCMPGATLDTVDGDRFTGRVKVKVGPIVITYQGVASFVEKDEATHRAIIDASGKESRGSGTANAKIATELIDRGEATDVQVVTDLTITGRPAQFGRGVIADVAGTLTNKFADALAEELARTPDGGDPSEGDGKAAAEGTAAADGKATAGSPAPTSGTSEPATAADTPASEDPGTHRHVHDDDVEPIDLLGVSAGPALKRLLPVLVGVGALVLAVVLRRRRRS